ncbi:MAG: BlaI/MecI/CopY family transcriptional regulator [Verrucomicrobia bacterium]|nr:BlaI/MecI/CopY family transcriptional regulator [Verrucomicrobiota bacterium]
MKSIPKISETEWDLMKILWAKSPLTSQEIIEALEAQDPTWHPKTARTLLNRLVRKKAVSFQMEGRIYLYRPLVKQADCVKAVSQSFLERVFGGSLKPMLAHYVEHQKLSAEEIRELKRLLEERE